MDAQGLSTHPQLSAGVGKNSPCRPRTYDLWPDLLSNFTDLAFPVKLSRRFNSACWLMPAAIIEFPAKAQPASRRLLDVPWFPNNIVSSSLSIHHRPFGQIRTWTRRSRCLPLDKIQNNSLVEGGDRFVFFCSCGQRRHCWYVAWIK